MRILKIFILLIPIGILSFSYTNDLIGIGQMHPAPEFCYAENQTFNGGEEINFKIFYQLNILWLAAGEVSFKITEDEDTYTIGCTGRTIAAFEWFYKVNDYYETVIDKETMLPIEFTRNISEGKFKLYNKFYFDQENRKVTSVKGRNKDETKTEYYELTDCMHDMMSILYYVRNLELEAYDLGDTIPVQVFLEKEYILNIKMIEKNKVKRFKGLGKYHANAMSPQVVAGKYFNEGTEMTVWFTADKNRVPLMVDSPVSVGRVKAVLQSFRGLKHPFDAVYFK